MKKGNLIFQIAISLAVIALFVLQFCCGGDSPSKATTTFSDSDSSQVKIAYIRLDSLLNNYELHKKYRSEIEETGRKIQADLARREQDVLYERQLLQQAAPGLTQQQLEQAQNDYMRVEQRYITHQQTVMANFQVLEDSLTGIVLSDVDSVVTAMQAEMGFDFLLQNEGTLLYGNEALNLTGELAQRLNEAYTETKTE